LTADPNAWRLATVHGLIRETERAVTIQFDVPDWPGHLAGQRIDIRLTAEDGYSATRAYSMASPPGTGTVDVTVEELMDGEVSPYLVEGLQVGDELEIRGPIGGAFTWKPQDGGPVLLVGGGSGLVPLMAMVRAHAAAGDDTDVRLLLSARTVGDVLYRAELEPLGTAGTITLHETLTRGAPAGWAGSDRRVDANMLVAIAPPPNDANRIFVCGPNAFVETVANTLIGLGHAPATIRTERFGPSAG
jgi:ferredoxin-NADP reductase